jgi:hypothetical protein
MANGPWKRMCQVWIKLLTDQARSSWAYSILFNRNKMDDFVTLDISVGLGVGCLVVAWLAIHGKRYFPSE